MTDPIIVTIGDDELTFNADDEDFNQYLNEQTPSDKVSPAWNFLSRTVDDSSRDTLNKVALTDNLKPKGIIVLQIAAVIVQELGGDLTIAVKKPKSGPKASKATATSN
ncbi:MAG: putative phage tail assembly chaperone [Methylococcales bacterium]